MPCEAAVEGARTNAPFAPPSVRARGGRRPPQGRARAPAGAASPALPHLRAKGAIPARMGAPPGA